MRLHPLKTWPSRVHIHRNFFCSVSSPLPLFLFYYTLNSSAVMAILHRRSTYLLTSFDRAFKLWNAVKIVKKEREGNYKLNSKHNNRQSFLFSPPPFSLSFFLSWLNIRETHPLERDFCPISREISLAYSVYPSHTARPGCSIIPRNSN